MLHSRRDLLKAGLTASSFIATQALPTALSAGEPATLESALKDLQVGTMVPQGKIIDWQVEHAKEIDEIVKYAHRLHNLRLNHPEQKGVDGISVPFATLPLNFYARSSEEALKLPMPQIPGIHRGMTEGWTSLMNMALQTLATRLASLSEAKTPTVTVEEFTNIEPSARRQRVISPMFTIDVDEPHYTMRTTAMMLIDSIVGIMNEWHRTIEMAKLTAKEAGNLTSPVVERKPIGCMINRDGFMLQYMAWQTGWGYIPGMQDRPKQKALET